MKFGKTPLFTAAMAAVVGATAIGAGAVSAAGGVGNGPFADLAGAIATHFNVDATEVQTIIDEQLAAHKGERHAQMEKDMQERLTAAVAAGTLTQAQADALAAHRAEMDTFLESLGLTKETLHEVLGAPGMGGHRGGPRGEFHRRAE